MSQHRALAVAASAALAAILLMASTAAAAPARPDRPQPSSMFNFRRALRLVVDTSVTEHWGWGQATAAATWVPAKAAHDKKKAAKDEDKKTEEPPKKIKETIYLKPVDECDLEDCIKQYIPDFSKKTNDPAKSTSHIVSIQKEAVLEGTVSGTTKALDVATKP